jgi:hypothetical protein
MNILVFGQMRRVEDSRHTELGLAIPTHIAISEKIRRNLQKVRNKK